VSAGQRTIVLSANRAEVPVMNLKLEIQASDSLADSDWTTLVEKSGDAYWHVAKADVDPPQESIAVNGSVPLQVQESVALPAADRRFYRLLVSVIPSP
jgi:hypothetical protein